MRIKTSDFLIERLHQRGIKRVYGFPGDGINGVMGALNRAKDKIDFIQVRHEEMAAFMACAHSKFTGEVGVCMATSGPGAIHLLNGLYDAKMDHQSVVAIVGQQASTSLGSRYQQEVDLLNLFKDVAHEYIQMVTDPAQLQQVLDQAIRTAKAERTVTCIIIPNNIQELDAVKQPPHMHGIGNTGIGFPAVRIVPSDEEIQRAAKVFNQGKKIAMLVGAGALGAKEEIKTIAELLGAGVAKALLGRAVVSDELPYVTGAIGLLGTKPSWNLMNECDTLFMIGSSFPYTEFLPETGKARGVQIDIDGRMLSLRYPMEINLVGDSKETLKALIPYLKYKKDRSWQEKIKKEITEWEKIITARAMNEANPINPQRVFSELSSRLPDNCILTADSGTSASWFARNLKIREGMMATLSGNLATMCPAVPYAIAAKFAYPDRVAIGLSGDGAMQMLGINELITISKYWKRWSDPRLIILVLHNNELNMVTWEQRVMVGDPKFEASQDIPDFNYAAYAELLGLKGIRVEVPGQIAGAWDEAFSADRPVVLDVLTDPNVPTISPHISFDETVKFTKTLLKGDPNEMAIITQTFKEIMHGI